MRLIALIGLALLAACASEACPGCDLDNLPPGTTRSGGQLRVPADYNVGRIQPSAPVVQDPVAVREDELLERALTGSPDYSAAIRRAATSNVDADQPLGVRRTALSAQAREQRIAAEEARLSDAVEKRRRDRLSQQAQADKAARDQQAIATCRARGAQTDAAYYSRRSLLNLEGMAAGNQAAAACLEAYQRTGILP